MEDLGKNKNSNEKDIENNQFDEKKESKNQINDINNLPENKETKENEENKNKFSEDNNDRKSANEVIDKLNVEITKENGEKIVKNPTNKHINNEKINNDEVNDNFEEKQNEIDNEKQIKDNKLIASEFINETFNKIIAENDKEKESLNEINKNKILSQEINAFEDKNKKENNNDIEINNSDNNKNMKIKEEKVEKISSKIENENCSNKEPIENINNNCEINNKEEKLKEESIEQQMSEENIININLKETQLLNTNRKNEKEKENNKSNPEVILNEDQQGETDKLINLQKGPEETKVSKENDEKKVLIDYNREKNEDIRTKDDIKISNKEFKDYSENNELQKNKNIINDELQVEQAIRKESENKNENSSVGSD